jgi:glycine cleavage system H protein
LTKKETRVKNFNAGLCIAAMNIKKEEDMNPENLKYHKEHTWVKVSGKKVTVGITVYIELPELEANVEANTGLSEIESTKATATVISPVSGIVTEINEELSDSPEVINEDPYERGWIAVIETENTPELDDFMDSSDYEKYLEEVKLK